MKIKIFENNQFITEENIGNKAKHFYIGVGRILTTYYQDLMYDKEEKEVEIKTTKGNALYTLKKTSYSLRIFEQENNIVFNEPLDFDKKYHLEMIGIEHNNYKYYDLEKIGFNEVTATWGRIAPRTESHLRKPYTYQQAYMKLGEKLAKGYKDMTFKIEEKQIKKVSESFSMEDTLNGEIKKDSTLSTVSERLYAQLLDFSKKMIRRTFQTEIVVTETMVRKAKTLYNKLLKQKTVEEFNEVLQEIMLLAPRKIDYMNGEKVKDYIAQRTEDFAKIIDREETILNSLQVINLSHKKEKKTTSPLDFPTDISVEMATDKERREVLSYLDSHLKAKVKNVYHVESLTQKQKYDLYIKEHNIHEFKNLWHGSKNENWLSIILNGLSLNPNAEITGKMLGNGIYFALESDKSYGYTSGGRWNNQYSTTRFMGLYECAYGNPLKHKGGFNHFTKEELDRMNKNCVHALGRNHGGNTLYRDEIVFFDESAINLNYIVEFED